MTLAIKIGLLLCIIGALAYGYLIYTPTIAAPALTGKAIGKTIRVGNIDRSYLAYLPARLAVGQPLLIVLHGTQQSGEAIRSATGYQFDRYADQYHYAVVYPDGIGGAWNDCRPKAASAAAVDDVGFIHAIVAQLEKEFASAAGQVYLFGYSNGGQMVFRLMSEAPEKYRRVAVVGANLPTAEYNQCQTDQPTPPILLANGTADPIVPFNGGKVTIFGLINRGFALSAEATAQQFAERNATSDPVQETILPGVERWLWTKTGAPYVARYSFAGAGHVVPQPVYRFPRLMGQTPIFDLPKAVIDFWGLTLPAGK